MLIRVSVSASYVVTHPTMDPSELPVIGTPPDELETPLVEENPINGNFLQQQLQNLNQEEIQNAKNGNIQPKPEKKQRVGIYLKMLYNLISNF